MARRALQIACVGRLVCSVRKGLCCLPNGAEILAQNLHKIRSDISFAQGLHKQLAYTEIAQ
jgi:hypothetical protein